MLVDKIMARLWEKMTQIFGHRWGSSFGEEHTGNEAWRKIVASLDNEELARGMEFCETRYTGEWPPTPGMFMSFCRPAVEYEAAFVHAVEQLARRRAEREQNWNCGQPNISPEALFWACSTMSGDMLTGTFKQLHSRWKIALDIAMSDPKLEPIPPMTPRLTRKHGGPTDTGKGYLSELMTMLRPNGRKPEGECAE